MMIPKPDEKTHINLSATYEFDAEHFTEKAAINQNGEAEVTEFAECKSRQVKSVVFNKVAKGKKEDTKIFSFEDLAKACAEHACQGATFMLIDTNNKSATYRNGDVIAGIILTYINSIIFMIMIYRIVRYAVRLRVSYLKHRAQHPSSVLVTKIPSMCRTDREMYNFFERLEKNLKI